MTAMRTMMTVIRHVSIDQTATSQHSDISKNIKFNEKKNKTKRKRPPLFPQKLYNMLENAETEGYDHLIGWSPDGKSFKIHNNGKDPAIVAVLEQHFNQTRFKSFLRQLQLYGFERQFTGDSRDERSHPMLVRGRKDLLHKKSVEDFQDAAANDTAEYKPTEYPFSSAEQLLYNFCKKETSSSSSASLPVSAVSSTTIEPISFFQLHTNGNATNCRQSPTATTSSTLVTYQQQQQSSFDIITSNIPTKLVNLVLRDCDDDNDDDDTSDSIYSINVFSRNLFDTTTYDDSSISSNEGGNDYADTADDDDDIHIAIIRNNVYPQWAGSSMELEILKTI